MTAPQLPPADGGDDGGASLTDLPGSGLRAYPAMGGRTTLTDAESMWEAGDRWITGHTEVVER